MIHYHFNIIIQIVWWFFWFIIVKPYLNWIAHTHHCVSHFKVKSKSWPPEGRRLQLWLGYTVKLAIFKIPKCKLAFFKLITSSNDWLMSGSLWQGLCNVYLTFVYSSLRFLWQIFNIDALLSVMAAVFAVNSTASLHEGQWPMTNEVISELDNICK